MHAARARNMATSGEGRRVPQAWSSAKRGSEEVRNLAQGWGFATTRRRLARAGASAAMAFASVVALGSPTALAAPEQLGLVVGGPGGSEPHRLAEVLSEPLAEVLGRPVVIDHVAADAGIAAAQAVSLAAPDGGTLLLADNLLLAVNEAAGAWPLSLEALRPVAKLTLGISVALAAPAESEITSWQALLDEVEQGSLRLSLPRRHAASDVARALLESETGIAFEAVEAADNQASLMDVAQGRTNVGLVTTNSIEAHNAVAEIDLQPIVTFGARRSPRHPDTPTFAELTADDKNDFTYSFALFGPPALPDELARELSDAIQTACAQPAALTAAGAAGLPLACHEAEVVRETVARDLRLARRALSDEK